MTSNVWEQFTMKEEKDGKEVAICNDCEKFYAYSSKKGTSSLGDLQDGGSLQILLRIPPPGVELSQAESYYVDDRVVNAYFNFLQRRYERFPDMYVKNHYYHSFYAVFMPICRHSHWSLFCADFEDKRMVLLDSLQLNSVTSQLATDISGWFKDHLLPSIGHNPEHWSFDVPTNIPLQKNPLECGLFVMKYADCLVHRHRVPFSLNVPFSQDDMFYFRYRAFLDLCGESAS
ncbi:hypothetical protein PTKIN_Ptkin04bG0242800 [Pterospermum kingtungense]